MSLFQPKANTKPSLHIVTDASQKLEVPAEWSLGDERNSREFHQASAMLAARSIKGMYSKEKKQKARSEVLLHLRASLCAPVAAGENTEMQSRSQV